MLYRDLAAVIEKVTCTLHPKKIKIQHILYAITNASSETVKSGSAKLKRYYCRMLEQLVNR